MKRESGNINYEGILRRMGGMTILQKVTKIHQEEIERIGGIVTQEDLKSLEDFISQIEENLRNKGNKIKELEEENKLLLDTISDLMSAIEDAPREKLTEFVTLECSRLPELLVENRGRIPNTA